MFCSHCGAPASGNFCSQCGARVAGETEGVVLLADWQHEVRYDVLLHFPEVRDLIAHHAAQGRKGISGEQFLGLCDKAVASFTHISPSTVATILTPIYTRIGIWTGKTRTAVMTSPVGKILVAAVCSLARYGRELKNVHQGADGCVLEARLPPSLWALEGELVISVRPDRAQTHVEAATKIPGQLYDWGKSNQCLNQLFEDLESLLTARKQAG